MVPPCRAPRFRALPPVEAAEAAAVLAEREREEARLARAPGAPDAPPRARASHRRSSPEMMREVDATGFLADDELALGARLEPPPPDAPEPEIVIEEGPPWDYETQSLFVPRKKLTDARSMLDRDAVKLDAFEADWRRLLASDGFPRGVERDKKLQDRALKLAKAALWKHYADIVHLFKYYCSRGDAEDCSSMFLNEWIALMLEADVKDDDSESVKQAHLGQLFIAVLSLIHI